MPDEFPYDVFLSHSARDKTVVRPLAERLKAAGVNPKAKGKMQSRFRETGEANAEILPSTFFILPSRLVALERSTAVHRDPANGAAGSSRSCWAIVLSRIRSGPPPESISPLPCRHLHQR